MKNIIFLFLIGLSTFSFAGADLGEFEPPYTVVADSFESAVPLGFCLVKGYAFNYGVAVPNGKVSTLNGVYHTKTDSSGAYKLLIPESDSSIFFFKSQFNEVVVWNYDFKSQHVVTLNFNSGANNLMLISDKPVIYLYSDIEISATLKLDYHGDITFTYPQLDSEWRVKISETGLEHKGKPYPYLFWEGESSSLHMNERSDHSVDGEIVENNSVISFLEQKLDELGFNSNEKTDFITFWGPRMIKSNYCLVQFVLDDDYEKQIASLTIQPKPDASRRVYMYFKAFDEVPEFEVHPQSFKSFERKGFALLEWGGSEIKTEKINL